MCKLVELQRFISTSMGWKAGTRGMDQSAAGKWLMREDRLCWLQSAGGPISSAPKNRPPGPAPLGCIPSSLARPAVTSSVTLAWARC